MTEWSSGLVVTTSPTVFSLLQPYGFEPFLESNLFCHIFVIYLSSSESWRGRLALTELPGMRWASNCIFFKSFFRSLLLPPLSFVKLYISFPYPSFKYFPSLNLFHLPHFLTFFTLGKRHWVLYLFPPYARIIHDVPINAFTCIYYFNY